ncbi:hypothetical protein EON81_03810 [bacterium]|nr:MAG: hypothetical protein EON81_03810 [bacterium]
MKKLLFILPLVAAVVGCSSGPRDATNDPEVQAMIKGVNEAGKMPSAESPSGTSGAGAPAPQTAPQ